MVRENSPINLRSAQVNIAQWKHRNKTKTGRPEFTVAECRHHRQTFWRAAERPVTVIGFALVDLRKHAQNAATGQLDRRPTLAKKKVADTGCWGEKIPLGTMSKKKLARRIRALNTRGSPHPTLWVDLSPRSGRGESQSAGRLSSASQIRRASLVSDIVPRGIFSPQRLSSVAEPFFLPMLVS